MLRILSRTLFCVVLLFAVAIPRSSFAQSAADVQTGKVLFGHLCVTCHGFDGAGGAGPPLNRAKLVNVPDDAALQADHTGGAHHPGAGRFAMVAALAHRDFQAERHRVGER